MNNDFERHILRQSGNLIKSAEFAHGWIVSDRDCFPACPALLRVQLDLGAGFSNSEADFAGTKSRRWVVAE